MKYIKLTGIKRCPIEGCQRGYLVPDYIRKIDMHIPEINERIFVCPEHEIEFAYECEDEKGDKYVLVNKFSDKLIKTKYKGRQ